MTKANFDNTVSSLNNKIAASKTKNELKKLKTFDSSYFISKSHFEEDITQNYLVFQPINRWFKVIATTDYVSSRKPKGLSVETIKPPTTSDNSLTQALSYHGNKIRVKFTRSCFKQSTMSYIHRPIVNIYIVYEFGASSSHNHDLTLRNWLFCAVTLKKNADVDKYAYSGYRTGFDRRSTFSFPGSGFGQNVLIFGADMSSSAHIDNKKKDVLVLGIGPTQGLEHTLTVEKIYSINFTVTKKKFCLNLHYNGANSYLFVNGTDIYKFKAIDSEIVAASLCLGNISKNWPVDNIKKSEFNGYFYDFSVNYDAAAVEDISDIHKYLIKKKWYGIIKYLDLLKNIFNSFIMYESVKCNFFELYFNE